MIPRGFHTPLIGAILLGFVSLAQAEPISATFIVKINECFGPCTPFPSSFPLTVTFDRGITRDDVGESSVARQYGPPTFSTVPLARASVHPDAISSSGTFHQWFRSFDGREFFYDSEVTEAFIHFPSNSFWQLSIGHRVAAPTPFSPVFDTPPPMTPESLISLMAVGPAAFLYGLLSEDEDEGPTPPDAVVYFGQISLVDSPAVPEPTTLALFAMAGATLVVRRRRK
jgi:hypothetical protein